MVQHRRLSHQSDSTKEHGSCQAIRQPSVPSGARRDHEAGVEVPRHRRSGDIQVLPAATKSHALAITKMRGIPPCSLFIVESVAVDYLCKLKKLEWNLKQPTTQLYRRQALHSRCHGCGSKTRECSKNEQLNGVDANGQMVNARRLRPLYSERTGPQ
jgi:hypothetical protein